MSQLVSRGQWRAFMQVGTDNKFEQMGEGFTSMVEAKNPVEYARRYIHEKTDRTDVVGYAPSIEYSVDVYSGDPVIEEIVKISETERTGADAQRDIVSVNLWQEAEGANAFIAYKRNFTIVPGGKGDGTDAVIYTGTLRANGEIVEGTFNITTKTFTAKSEEPAV